MDDERPGTIRYVVLTAEYFERGSLRRCALSLEEGFAPKRGRVGYRE